MNKKLFLSILNSGVDISHYFLLCLINNEELDNTVAYQLKVKSWLLAMEKKGLIINMKDNIQLTAKGLKILTQINQDQSITEPSLVISERKIQSIAIDINRKVNDKIYKSTKNKRLTYKTKDGSYIINVSNIELENSLINFIKTYEFIDFKAIENAILAYVEDLLDGKISHPKKLNNFIIKTDKVTKESESDLMMYLETMTPKEERKIINTRDLFG